MLHTASHETCNKQEQCEKRSVLAYLCIRSCNPVYLYRKSSLFLVVDSIELIIDSEHKLDHKHRSGQLLDINMPRFYAKWILEQPETF